MIKNFPGFTVVKNFAPYTVEFQWNTRPYVFEPGEVANMPNELAYAAIKGTVYRIDPDGTAYSCIHPVEHPPAQPIPPKTGDPVKDYTLVLDDQDQFKPLPVPFVDRVKHVRIQKDFQLTADGRGND